MPFGHVCFVTGAPGSGTSTMVGMLNCHPEILLLYEVEMFRDCPTKYGRQFLHAYPAARRLFRSDADVGRPYAELRAWLELRGHSYTYVGDKVLGLSTELLQRMQTHKVVFMVRDVRTWLCKNSVAFHYVVEHDVVPAAIDYTRYFLHSFQLPQCLRIRLEDVIHDHQGTVHRLSAFLGLDLSGYLNSWWEQQRCGVENDPKHVLNWLEVHPSARIKPRVEDTRATLREHAFWSRLLPLFDKYYRAIDVEIEQSEVKRDLELLEGMRDLEAVSIKDCYTEIQSLSLKRETPQGKLIGYVSSRLERGRFRSEYDPERPHLSREVVWEMGDAPRL